MTGALSLLMALLFCVIFIIAASMVADIYRDEIVKNAQSQKKKETLTKGAKRIAAPISRQLIKLIHLQPITHNRIKRDLDRAEMDITPEQYYADAISIGLLISLTTIPLLLLGTKLLVIVGPILGVYVGYNEINSAKNKLKALDERIEQVLPSFARIVQENVATTKDLPKIFKQYLHDIPDTPLKHDLTILISRMQTGYGQEAALIAFKDTIKNDACNKFVDALISVVNGVDQKQFMKQINQQIATLSEENAKREIAKRGPKLKKSKIAMILCAGATLVVPVVINLINGAGSIFGVF